MENLTQKVRAFFAWRLKYNIGCHACLDCTGCEDCFDCSRCFCCFSCEYLKNCIFCHGLNGRAEASLEYYAFNEKVTKEEFEAIVQQAKDEGLIWVP